MHSDTRQVGTQPSGAQAASAPARMRMADLVERTGVPKTTILYYLREGLLPAPQRPFPNQALYGPAHVDRLQLIKQVQRTSHFPLAKIRRLVEMVDRGASPAAVARLNERLFAARAGALSDRRWSLPEFCAETGLEPSAVRQALEADVLNPLVQAAEPEFDSADVEVGHALATGRRFGMVLEDLEVLVEHARAIADAEMAMRERVVAGRPLDEDIEVTTELTDMARTLHTYIVDRMFIATATQQPFGGEAVP